MKYMEGFYKPFHISTNLDLDGRSIMENKEKDKITAIVEMIRNNTKDVKLTKLEDLPMEDLDFESLWNQISEKEEFADIKKIDGSKGIYLYSELSMTNNYANMLARIEDKDLLKAIAETVRNESRIYPRPTSSKLFTSSPFSIKKEELSDILSQLKAKEEYKDICETTASNGTIYLYSNKYMTKGHAQALTEWIEVLQYQNP